jgi:hypothetical protein
VFHWAIEVLNTEDPWLKSKSEVKVKVAFINVEIGHDYWGFLRVYGLWKQSDKEEGYKLDGVPHREYE